MVFGISLSTYTLVHVVVSLAGIGSGFVEMYDVRAAGGEETQEQDGALPDDNRVDQRDRLRLYDQAFDAFARRRCYLPGAAYGGDCVALRFSSRGRLARDFVVTAVLSLYINVFVAVLQAFSKIPALKAIAPTRKEPPFAIAQLVVLVLFVLLTIVALNSFTSRPRLNCHVLAQSRG